MLSWQPSLALSRDKHEKIRQLKSKTHSFCKRIRDDYYDVIRIWNTKYPICIPNICSEKTLQCFARIFRTFFSHFRKFSCSIFLLLSVYFLSHAVQFLYVHFWIHFPYFCYKSQMYTCAASYIPWNAENRPLDKIRERRKNGILTHDYHYSEEEKIDSVR